MHARKSSTDACLELLHSRASFFADPCGEPYAELSAEAGRDVLRLRSGAFRAWLDRVAFEHTGSVPSPQTKREALSVLVATARYKTPPRAVHVRLAEHEGALYLDLGGPERDVVRIDGAEW